MNQANGNSGKNNNCTSSSSSSSGSFLITGSAENEEKKPTELESPPKLSPLLTSPLPPSSMTSSLGGLPAPTSSTLTLATSTSTSISALSPISLDEFQATFFGPSFSSLPNSPLPALLSPLFSPVRPIPRKRNTGKGVQTEPSSSAALPKIEELDEQADATKKGTLPQETPFNFSSLAKFSTESSKCLQSSDQADDQGEPSASERRLMQIYQLGLFIEDLLQDGDAGEYVQSLVDDFRASLDEHAEAKAWETEEDNVDDDQRKIKKKEEDKDKEHSIEEHCKMAYGAFLARIARLKYEQEEKEDKLSENFDDGKGLKLKSTETVHSLPSKQHAASSFAVDHHHRKWPSEMIPRHDGRTMTFPAFWRTFQLTFESLHQPQLDHFNPEMAKFTALLSAVHLADSVAIIADGCASMTEAELFLRRKYLSPKAVREVIQQQLTTLKKVSSKSDQAGLQALRDFLQDQVMPLVELMYVEGEEKEGGDGGGGRSISRLAHLANFCGYGPQSKADALATIFDLLHNHLSKGLGGELTRKLGLGADFSMRFLLSGVPQQTSVPKKDLALLGLFLDDALARARQQEMATRGGGLVRRLVASVPLLQRHFASNSEAAEAKAKKAAVAAVSKKIADNAAAAAAGKADQSGGPSKLKETVKTAPSNGRSASKSGKHKKGLLFGFNNAHSYFKFGEWSTIENGDDSDDDDNVTVSTFCSAAPKDVPAMKMVKNPLYDYVLDSEPESFVSKTPTAPKDIAAVRPTSVVPHSATTFHPASV